MPIIDRSDESGGKEKPFSVRLRKSLATRLRIKMAAASRENRTRVIEQLLEFALDFDDAAREIDGEWMQFAAGKGISKPQAAVRLMVEGLQITVIE